MTINSKPVTVAITCTIKPDKIEVAKRELSAIIKTVMATERECKGIRVHEDPDDLRRLLIIEYWDSKQHFLGPHMQTPHMVEFLKTAESFLDGKAEFSFWNENSAFLKVTKFAAPVLPLNSP
jgi:quinol monooxygenase YgiN